MPETLKDDIDNSVKILRKYRKNAIERKNENAEKDIKTIMRAIQKLYKLVFAEEKIK